MRAYRHVAAGGIVLVTWGSMMAGCASSIACGDEVERLRTATSDVWLASLDDRPLTFASFPSDALAPYVPDDIAHLAGLDASIGVEERDPSTFLDALEPSPRSPRSDAPARLRAEIDASLFDTQCFALHSAPQHIESVRVVLVGRTACGDRVWIESVAIETTPTP